MTKHLPPTLMIFEKDNVTRTSISNILERKGFNVIASDSIDTAIIKLSKSPSHQLPNIIIYGEDLDNNFEILSNTIKKLKEDCEFIFLIKESSEKSMQKNSTFLVKPFSQSDLLQKVQNILSHKKPALSSRIMKYKDLKIDLSSYQVIRGSRQIHLGPTEFRILQLLLENPTKQLSREQIMKYIWNNSNVEERTIDVHVNRLRSALKEPGEKTSYIKTIRSIGYCLEE